MNDKIFTDIVEKIISEQEVIIGPIAIQQAQLVHELTIDWAQHSVNIAGAPQTAIDDLVEQYKVLFGQIAVETCKEATSRLVALLPPDQQPKSLQ